VPAPGAASSVPATPLPVPDAPGRGPDPVAVAAGALVARQAVVSGANLLGSLLLARATAPEVFGAVTVALLVQSLLTAIGGPGLAAGLVRRPTEPDETDCRVLFTFQQALGAALAGGVWLLAPAVAEAYGRPPEDAWLFRWVGVAFAVLPVQSVPALRLERALDFGRLGVVDAVQALVLNGGIVAAAWSGAAPAGFGLAFAARAVAGAALAQALRPWRPAWAWDRSRLRAQLGFALPYQGSILVSVARDAVGPVLVGLTVGAAAVGHVQWALTLASFPVWAMMPFQRLYLPAFARVQHDRAALARLVERVVRGANTVVAPLATLSLALAEPITRVVFGPAWLPALPLWPLFWTANLWAATATPLLALLNAVGRAGTTFGFSVAWMAATWLLAAPLVAAFGTLGFGLAHVAVQLVNLALFREARRVAPLRLGRAALPPWLGATLIGAVVHVIALRWPPRGLPSLLAFLLVPLVAYGGLFLGPLRPGRRGGDAEAG